MTQSWRPRIGEKVEYLGKLYAITRIDNYSARNLRICNGESSHCVSHFTVKPVDQSPPENLPEYSQFDLERALNRLKIVGRAVPLAEIPDIDPIVLVQ
jgi:hypothetical protein